MNEKSKLIRVYSGSEMTINLLRDELEKSGISTLIQNDFNSGISAGFSGGTPTSIDLFVQEEDLEIATPIISDFEKLNKE